VTSFGLLGNAVAKLLVLRPEGRVYVVFVLTGWALHYMGVHIDDGTTIPAHKLPFVAKLQQSRRIPQQLYTQCERIATRSAARVGSESRPGIRAVARPDCPGVLSPLTAKLVSRF
jgi:hypothetical protein